MAFTSINGEDRLVQATFAAHLQKVLGWENVYAFNDETFGPDGTLGRRDTRDVVLTRDLRAAIVRLNPDLPGEAIEQAVTALSQTDLTRSLLQHNQAYYPALFGDRCRLQPGKGPGNGRRHLYEACGPCK